MFEFSGLEQLVKAGQPTGESFDCIQGEGKVDELPIFLIRSLRQIIYRLRNSGMWSGDNDIRIHFSTQRELEFVNSWYGYLGCGGFWDINSEVGQGQILRDEVIVIDGITTYLNKIPGEMYPHYYYLAVHSVGQNQLIAWDEKLNRWLFRAPWAIARFEIKE